jgi:hypothetical protein
MEDVGFWSATERLNQILHPTSYIINKFPRILGNNLFVEKIKKWGGIQARPEVVDRSIPLCAAPQ